MRKYCVECKIELTEDNKSKGISSRCKPCYATYMKQYYKNNPDKYNKQKSYVESNDALWTEKVDTFLAQRLFYGCIDCGEKDPVVLEFDHRESEKKEYGISRLRKHKVAWHILEKELEKCDVVCANCHRRRTAKEFGNWRLNLSTH